MAMGSQGITGIGAAGMAKARGVAETLSGRARKGEEFMRRLMVGSLSILAGKGLGRGVASLFRECGGIRPRWFSSRKPPISRLCPVQARRLEDVFPFVAQPDRAFAVVLAIFRRPVRHNVAFAQRMRGIAQLLTCPLHCYAESVGSVPKSRAVSIARQPKVMAGLFTVPMFEIDRQGRRIARCKRLAVVCGSLYAFRGDTAHLRKTCFRVVA